MDSFMDKIAHKLSGSDVIKANSEAEAKELESYKEVFGEYKELLEDLRRLNLKCVETNEMTSQLVSASIERIEGADLISNEGVIDSKLGEKLDAVSLSLNEKGEKLDAVTQGVNETKEKLDFVTSGLNETKEKVSSSLDALRASSMETLDEISENTRNSNEEIKTYLSQAIENLETSLSKVREDVAQSSNDASVSLKEVMNKSLEDIKAATEKAIEDMNLASKKAQEDLTSVSRQAQEENKNALGEVMKEQEDFIHKENVRVYRNVQAAVVEELKLQTEALAMQNQNLEKKVKGFKVFSILSTVFSGISMIGIIAAIVWWILAMGL